MNKFFAFFGKAILGIALLGGIAYGAYSLGKLSTSPFPDAALLAEVGAMIASLKRL